VRTLHRKARRDLRRLGLQAVTVALLVASGVGLLVAAWSSYEALKRAKDSFYSDARFADSFADLKRAPRQVLPRIRRLPGVIEIDDRVVLYGRVYQNESVAMAKLVSLPDSVQPPLNRVHLRMGRLPRVKRNSKNEIEVLVHEAFAKAHGLGFGATLRAVSEGKEERFQVVGIGISPDSVYALSGRSPFPDDKRFGIFWVARNHLEEWGGLKDSFNHLAIRHDPTRSKEIQNRLEHLLRSYGARSVTPRSRQISNLFVEDEIHEQRVSAVIYPTIFLSVAAFLIHIASARWVELQRLQIATLKSLGYSHLRLSLHLLEVILWILFFGTIVGILMGMGVGRIMAWSYQQFFRFPDFDYHPSPLGLALGAASGLVPGLLGSAASLRSLFKLQPAEAMRPPSPVDYRGGRWRGPASIPVRMVWRNLFVRKWRLLIAVSGISCGISIVVLSGAWRDILRSLLETQFFRVEREDVSAFLVEARPLSSLQELRTIPGVLSLEGYRFVPARLRFRQNEREVPVMGWAPHSQHRRRLGVSEREEPLPSSGILMPKSLADLWGVSRGDWVRLEIQAGKMPELALRVEGFSETRMGNLISLPHDRLAKLLDETPSVSLLTLKVDSNLWESVQKRVEEFPGVAGAAVKNWRLQGFQQTIGKIIRISTWILSIFAFLIAGGVVFNLVRVSFSERSWEMASLRVLGFSEWAVLKVLALEVSFEVAASLIPGFLLGVGWVYLSQFWIHTEAFKFPVIVERATFGIATLLALGALLMGVYSCWRRTRALSPIAALQAPE
jgi:putative ABC transport system permease protein